MLSCTGFVRRRTWRQSEERIDKTGLQVLRRGFVTPGGAGLALGGRNRLPSSSAHLPRRNPRVRRRRRRSGERRRTSGWRSSRRVMRSRRAKKPSRTQHRRMRLTTSSRCSAGRGRGRRGNGGDSSRTNNSDVAAGGPTQLILQLKASSIHNPAGMASIGFAAGGSVGQSAAPSPLARSGLCNARRKMPAMPPRGGHP